MHAHRPTTDQPTDDRVVCRVCLSSVVADSHGVGWCDCRDSAPVSAPVVHYTGRDKGSVVVVQRRQGTFTPGRVVLPSDHEQSILDRAYRATDRERFGPTVCAACVGHGRAYADAANPSDWSDVGTFDAYGRSFTPASADDGRVSRSTGWSVGGFVLWTRTHAGSARTADGWSSVARVVESCRACRADEIDQSRHVTHASGAVIPTDRDVPRAWFVARATVDGCALHNVTDATGNVIRTRTSARRARSARRSVARAQSRQTGVSEQTYRGTTVADTSAEVRHTWKRDSDASGPYRGPVTTSFTARHLMADSIGPAPKTTRSQSWRARVHGESGNDARRASNAAIWSRSRGTSRVRMSARLQSQSRYA